MGKASGGKASGGKASGGKDRRQRVEQLKREQQRRERRRTVGFVTAGVVVGAGIIVGAVVPSVLHKAAVRDQSKVGYRFTPTAAEKQAGCEGTLVQRQVSRDHSTSTVDYADVPPTSGVHNPDPLYDQTRFYPLSVKAAPERAVHNLEHGFVVAWYDDRLPAAQVDQLRTTAETTPRFLAVGWTRGELPDGKHLVLTAWDRIDRCTGYSPTVGKAFYDKWHDATAPEPGGGGGSNTPPGQLVDTSGTTAPSTSPTDH